MPSAAHRAAMGAICDRNACRMLSRGLPTCSQKLIDYGEGCPLRHTRPSIELPEEVPLGASWHPAWVRMTLLSSMAENQPPTRRLEATRRVKCPHQAQIYGKCTAAALVVSDIHSKMQTLFCEALTAGSAA